MSHADGSTGLVLGGETASLLDVAPRAPPPRGEPLSRTLETRGEGGAGYYTEGERMDGAVDEQKKWYLGRVEVGGLNLNIVLLLCDIVVIFSIY